MKKLIFCTGFLFLILNLQAQNEPSVSIGLHLLAGGRYDDVRMCVGSGKGIKGGPIMDVYLDIRFPLSNRGTLAVNIPVMRPILFAASFQMLQFEPQVTYEHRFPRDPGKPGFVLSGGLGLVFHYGPDYNSTPEERGESFFSMGPLFTGSAGVLLEGKRGNWIPGIKAFYSPLFSPEYTTGQVLGGGVELHYEF